MIGVYDSGVGGLTTLAELKKRIPQADFYYLADNKNMPLGLKRQEDAEEIVFKAVKKLKARSDVCVLACNTASITSEDKDVFKLLPDLDGLIPEETLVMATPLTLNALKANARFFNTAETSELATLTEIQCSLIYKSRKNLDMGAFKNYLSARLSAFKDIKNVVFGCSHYVYSEAEAKKLIPEAKFFDGNDKLSSSVAEFTRGIKGNGKIKFGFSGSDESQKYAYLLEKLLNN